MTTQLHEVHIDERGAVLYWSPVSGRFVVFQWIDDPDHPHGGYEEVLPNGGWTAEMLRKAAEFELPEVDE